VNIGRYVLHATIGRGVLIDFGRAHLHFNDRLLYFMQ